jgi:inhibitor of cysteine peptidase
MKKSIFALLALGTIAAVLGGCMTSNPSAPEEVDAGDGSAPVALQVGQTVKIDLEENPSTGYTWQWECDTPEAVELVGDDYVQGGEEDMVGAPGMRSFRFKALAPATATISFTYGQDWDGGQQAPESAKTLVLKISE